jgi:predicted hydrocarbon binding protein
MAPDAANAPRDGIAIGREGLRALRASLLSRAPDQALAVLQETGYAAGEGVYRAFCAWLPGATGFAIPAEIDAGKLSAVLSRFFQAAGWGGLAISSLGGGTLALDSEDWAEAEPASSDQPTCFLTAGMLADFFGRLSGSQVGVMEVECRSRNDARCRFLTAVPERLQEVYETMTAGKSYTEALGLQ